jgi:tetratricopeptide (TPR) repeat protein
VPQGGVCDAGLVGHSGRNGGKTWNLAVALLLAVATLSIYSQVRHFEITNYDDPDYVTENSHVRAGITAEGVKWAFTSSYAANWIPLTWLSHMADVELWGLDGGGHHLGNVVLHVMSTLLLFAFLLRATGVRWRSALVAFLFALHPLHVQSVAWIAERKDTLSAFFGMLALWLYGRYAERPTTGRYVAVAAAFTAALLSKPMAVTLPLVFLLADYWPLERKLAWRQAVREKTPLFVLSAAAAVVTFFAQRAGGAVMTLESIPLPDRIANAAISVVEYLRQMIWPAGLAVFYPYPASFPIWKTAGALALLIAISVLVWRSGRRYLATGWLWFLVTLAPVIGVVQVGEQARADRYVYIPLIGIAIAAVWGIQEITRRMPPALPAALAGAVCAAYASATWFEIGYWRNSETLMSRAIEVTDGNYVAHDNLGAVLRSKHRTADAIGHFREALRVRPQSVEAHINLGEALVAEGKIGEALPEIETALRLNPNIAEAQMALGLAMDKTGRIPEAVAAYRRAVEIRPESAPAHTGYGQALGDAGHMEPGLAELREAIRLRPEYADGHYALGLALAKAGRPGEAADEFAATVRLAPDDAEAHYNLGTALGALGRMEEAAREFREAMRIRPRYANAELNLAKSLALLGKYDEAAAHASEALRLDPTLADARDVLDALKEASR